MLHELAHLARYDDWTNLFARLIGAILPIHPVAVWLVKQIEQDRETACDDWVVAMTGEARPYAASLTRLFELCSARRRQLLATGMADRASHLGERIEALLRSGRDFAPRVSLVRVALGAAILLGLVFAGAQAPHWVAFAQEPAVAPVAPLPPLPPSPPSARARSCVAACTRSRSAAPASAAGAASRWIFDEQTGDSTPRKSNCTRNECRCDLCKRKWKPNRAAGSPGNGSSQRDPRSGGRRCKRRRPRCRRCRLNCAPKTNNSASRAKPSCCPQRFLPGRSGRRRIWRNLRG